MTFRVSLRALVAGVALLSVTLGVIGRHWRETVALRELKSMGAFPAELCKFQMGESTDLFKPLSPGAGIALLHFERPMQANLPKAVSLASRVSSLEGISIVDYEPVLDLSQLHALKNLDFLEISGPIEFADLEHLAGFRNITYLRLLNNANIDNAAVRSIGACSSLRGVDVSRSAITDAGVEELLLKLKLHELRLRNTPVTPAVYETFGRGSHLQVLDVSRSNWPRGPRNKSFGPGTRFDPGEVVTTEFHRLFPAWHDEAFAPELVVTAEFPPTLEELDCSGWQLSRPVLASLAKLPELEYLNLSGSAISEADLMLISECRNLRRLGVAGTALSDSVLPALL